MVSQVAQPRELGIRLGAIFQEYLFERDIPLTRLATDLGIPESTLRGYVNDGKSMDFNALAAIVDKLPVEIRLACADAFLSQGYQAVPMQTEDIPANRIVHTVMLVASDAQLVAIDMAEAFSDGMLTKDEARPIIKRLGTIIGRAFTVKTQVVAWAGRNLFIRCFTGRRA